MRYSESQQASQQHPDFQRDKLLLLQQRSFTNLASQGTNGPRYVEQVTEEASTAWRVLPKTHNLSHLRRKEQKPTRDSLQSQRLEFSKLPRKVRRAKAC